MEQSVRCSVLNASVIKEVQQVWDGGQMCMHVTRRMWLQRVVPITTVGVALRTWSRVRRLLSSFWDGKTDEIVVRERQSPLAFPAAFATCFSGPSHMW